MTEKDAYPLLHVTATLDKLRRARYLSTLDLKSGYWQIPLHLDSRPIMLSPVEDCCSSG